MMSDPASPQMAAHRLLKQWDCTAQPQPSDTERDAIHKALILLTKHSDYQILGICADSAGQGIQALNDYAIALSLPIPESWPNLPPGPVYLKLNPKLGRCYADTYPGEHRGVLVSYQSAYDDGINEMYGHLPLDLFS
jgi:Domain of unknown function (DUF1824)